jgi:hypothetical protein
MQQTRGRSIDRPGLFPCDVNTPWQTALKNNSAADATADPLPSWNDAAAKRSILGFVEKVTQQGSPSSVPVAALIATFDNDGTLWCEQPVPVQVYFAYDRAKSVVSQHPEWQTTEPQYGTAAKELHGWGSKR